MYLPPVVLVLVVVGVLVLAGGMLRARRREQEHRTRAQAATALVTRVTANYASLQRQKDEIFNQIESIVAERMQAMSLYQVQASEHAAAQDMMMREIASCEHQYEGLRQRVAAASSLDAAHAAASRKLRRNATLALLAEEFRTTHAPDQVVLTRTSGCAPGGEPPAKLDSPAPTP